MNATIGERKANKTKVSEIMTRSVHTIGMNDSLADALRIMIEGVNCLPVVSESGKCVGILSRVDLSEFLFFEDQQLARIVDAQGAASSLQAMTLDTCNEKQVRELMSDVVTLATEKTTIQEACEVMTQSRIHHLPVAYHGKLVGIVSSLDIINWLADD